MSVLSQNTKTSPLRAYPDMPAEIEAIIRLPGVVRWHIVETGRPQNLAEHSAVVALLVYYISLTAPLGFFGNAQVNASCALLHDIHEGFTGDFPSNVKKSIGGLEELEQSIGLNAFNVTLNPPAQTLIKVCDLMSDIRFIRFNGTDGIGQWAHHQMVARLNTIITESDWPQNVKDHVTKVYGNYVRG